MILPMLLFPLGRSGLVFLHNASEHQSSLLQRNMLGVNGHNAAFL